MQHMVMHSREDRLGVIITVGWIFNLHIGVYISFKGKLNVFLLQGTFTELQRHTAVGLGCSLYIIRL